MTNEQILEELQGELTQERAAELGDTGWWILCSRRRVALTQLRQERLCMPFAVFHEAVEKAVGYGVFTHEFGSRERVNQLIEEIEAREATDEPVRSGL